jgi:hypothetical protein
VSQTTDRKSGSGVRKIIFSVGGASVAVKKIFPKKSKTVRDRRKILTDHYNKTLGRRATENIVFSYMGVTAADISGIHEQPEMRDR